MMMGTTEKNGYMTEYCKRCLYTVFIFVKCIYTYCCVCGVLLYKLIEL
jgi:hypothetical protein